MVCIHKKNSGLWGFLLTVFVGSVYDVNLEINTDPCPHPLARKWGALRGKIAPITLRTHSFEARKPKLGMYVPHMKYIQENKLPSSPNFPDKNKKN